MSGQLEGINVISMGQVVAIPAASAVLADWGAQVIKLEPLSGEIHRGLVKLHGNDIGQINWMIQLLNRNSRGLALDLKKEAGKDILYRLVKKSDVFMSNYEMSSITKLKLNYSTLSQLNPRLIYAVINGYGASGPDKNERGYDFAAGWARSGMMHLIGEPGNNPVSQRAGMIDSIAGAHIVGAICASLLQRERTGKGQEIDVSLYHTAVWTLSMDIQAALSGGEPTKRSRTTASNPLFNSYRTEDNRWFWLAMMQSDLSWPNFCHALERPDLENDSRFATMQLRTQNNVELINLIDEILCSRTLNEWEMIFRQHNIIYGRVQTPTEVIQDPQALANNFFQEIEYPGAGKIRLVASPTNFHQDPASIRTPAPEVGQHTEEILLELDYTWDDIAQLKEQKVIL
jgi:crotonobetainyl-CoA:carnitine CoA-transferase CaiB-like acyl-CoA transferase